MIDTERSLDKQKTLQKMGYYGLVHGVNVNVSDILQKNTELLESINLTSNKLGVLTPYPYKTQYNNVAVVDKAFLGGCVFRDESGTSHLVVAINKADNSVSQIHEVGVSANALKKDSLAAGKQHDFISLLGHLFAINETNGLATTADLTTWGTKHAVSAPKGRFIEEFGNEPYIAGDPSNKYRVYKGFLHNPAVSAVAYVVADQTSVTTINVDDTKYLKVGMVVDIIRRYTTTRVVDSRTITAINSETQIVISGAAVTILDSDEIYLEDTRVNAAGSAVVNEMRVLWSADEDNFDLPPNGESITGMRKNSNRLVVFQENTMHRWDGAMRTEVSPTVGCSSDKSIISMGNLLFWMHKGVMYFYDGSEPEAISEAIQPVLDTMTTFDQCIGIGDEANKRIAMYLGTVNHEWISGDDVWAIYYYKQDKFEFVKGIPASIAIKDITQNSKPIKYVGDNHGLIWKFLEGYSQNRAYSATSKFDCQGDPSAIKDYRYIVTLCRRPGGKLLYALDYKNDFKPLGDITEIVQAFELPQGTLGNAISVKWADSGAYEQPEFMGFEVLFDPKGIA